jgi:uncharacterized damage-inducible protein DinB
VNIADLYPYWERERSQLFEGLDEIVRTLARTRSPEEIEQVFDWIPPGGRRSISDTMRHMAYVEYYIIEKLILDREPKTILQGSLFPKADYPTHADVVKLMHDVHATTVSAYETLSRADLQREVPAFRRKLPIERLLWSIVQEEAHHRGQVYILLRMQDIPPPQRTD